MELLLKRKHFTSLSTVSELYINGEFFSHILEDVDRALDSNMGRERIGWLKQYGKTAIPYGRYEVVISYSHKFKKYLPLLVNVPGYDGIRFHPGNYHTDTEGCLLPGIYGTTPDFVGKSVLTFNKLMSILEKTIKKEKIFITITKHEDS